MGTFLNSVKNLINSLTAKTSSTASTSDIIQLYDNAGNPNGKIALSDLASVLGGIRISIESGADLDDYTKEGKYRASSDAIARSCSNSPVSVSFILNVYDGYNSSVQQIIQFNGSTIFMRRYQKSNDTWGNWYKYSGVIPE